MTQPSSFVVAGSRPWNRRSYEWLSKEVRGHWSFVSDPAELTAEIVDRLRPDWIFFLHWSWIVPATIHERYRCVVFHMTDVPYGRGGSPLQNLILRGHRETRLSALRMTAELDAGPVYLKEPLTLEGSAEQILARASDLSARMAVRLIRESPDPVTQAGEVVMFQRRTPAQSRIPRDLSVEALYDHIRMLDADGYPRAFVEDGRMRYVFSEATFLDDRVSARVEIMPAVQSP